ncbi:MAG: hypothetical protein HOY79_41610 [Streptomyces sp.]|nr:hypothetical protein [Streptomyces sp.]
MIAAYQRLDPGQPGLHLRGQLAVGTGYGQLPGQCRFLLGDGFDPMRQEGIDVLGSCIEVALLLASDEGDRVGVVQRTVFGDREDVVEQADVLAGQVPDPVEGRQAADERGQVQAQSCLHMVGAVDAWRSNGRGRGRSRRA